MYICRVLLTRSCKLPNSYHTFSGTESVTVRAGVFVAQKFDLRNYARGHLSNSGQLR